MNDSHMCRLPFVERATGPSASAEISALMPKYRQCEISVRSQTAEDNVNSQWNSICSTRSRAVPLQCCRFAADFVLLLVHRRSRLHANELLQGRAVRLRMLRTHRTPWRSSVSL